MHSLIQHFSSQSYIIVITTTYSFPTVQEQLGNSTQPHQASSHHRHHHGNSSKGIKGILLLPLPSLLSQTHSNTRATISRQHLTSQHLFKSLLQHCHKHHCYYKLFATGKNEKTVTLQWPHIHTTIHFYTGASPSIGYNNTTITDTARWPINPQDNGWRSNSGSPVKVKEAPTALIYVLFPEHCDLPLGLSLSSLHTSS